jgi:hypothetical protein
MCVCISYYTVLAFCRIGILDFNIHSTFTRRLRLSRGQWLASFSFTHRSDNLIADGNCILIRHAKRKQLTPCVLCAAWFKLKIFNVRIQHIIPGGTPRAWLIRLEAGNRPAFVLVVCREVRVVVLLVLQEGRCSGASGSKAWA